MSDHFRSVGDELSSSLGEFLTLVLHVPWQFRQKSHAMGDIVGPDDPFEHANVNFSVSKSLQGIHYTQQTNMETGVDELSIFYAGVPMFSDGETTKCPGLVFSSELCTL